MVTPSASSPQLRPIDIRKDLAVIADLIELCFSDHLDADGRIYLEQMRKAARNAHYFAWAMGAKLQMPVSGYVWEDSGRVIGNVSLVPVNKDGVRTFMIANVAVHPDSRRMGIGRALTEKAVLYCAEQNCRSVWLQVRDDNEDAARIYQGLGFIERVRRSTWIVDPARYQAPQNDFSQLKISRRRNSDSQLQFEWLDTIYPPVVRWNLSLRHEILKPGLDQALWRFFNEIVIHHWSVRVERQLIGVASWTPSHLAEDNLWLAGSLEWEETFIRSVLPHITKSRIATRPLTLNYPAGRCDSAFMAAGFQKQNTLIWMEKTFPQD
jgi:ribosomal protein S18 acetylase RimI-like enzyme